MDEKIVIGIKTSTSLTAVPVDVGLHDLLEDEWRSLLYRETELWGANLKLFTQRNAGGPRQWAAETDITTPPGQTPLAAEPVAAATVPPAGATTAPGEPHGPGPAAAPPSQTPPDAARPVRQESAVPGEPNLAPPGAPSDEFSFPIPGGGDECCADQFALTKSLQGLLGQRLEGIVEVELSWSVENAPEDSRVHVRVKEQLIHQAPYQHYQDAPHEPGALVDAGAEPQSYPVAINQPHVGSLTWTVNDHAPARPGNVGDYIEFVVEVQRGGTPLRHESVRVLMPRATP